MKKLEIKHLAPYLPYGIRVRVDYYTRHEGRIFKFSPDILLDFSRDEYIVKPILRPLSDLTKKIEVNGEKFIPLYKLIKEDKAFTTDFIYAFGYEELKVSVYELLLEWHFDVFGLIEKGLAIDINTLNQEL